eukprot:NODE_134_length_16603_cov_0.784052.p10 type:complete len:208 gc:universal NODE_134_length_16603_cov_0.784052:12403-13026(+)
MFVYLYLAFGIILVTKLNHEGLHVLIYQIQYAVVALISLILCIMIKKSNPGFLGNPIVRVKSNSLSDLKDSLLAKRPKKINFVLPLTDQDQKFENYCAICRTFKNDKVYHCNQVGRCVEQFDHFCFLFENAIGKNNYNLFLFTLIVLDVIVLWTIVIFRDYRNGFELAAFISLLFCGLFSFALTGFHCYLKLSKKRTVDILLSNKVK